MIGTGRELGGHIGLDRPGVGVSPNGAGAGHEVGAEGDFGELGVRKSRAKGSLRIDNELLEMAVELIKLIFNLALSDYDQAYKLRSSHDGIIKIVRETFEQMGLVEFTSYDKDKFYVTKLMQSFLLAPSENGLKHAAKFIVLETNFRVFAYTPKKLYREILKIFLLPMEKFCLAYQL